MSGSRLGTTVDERRVNMHLAGTGSGLGTAGSEGGLTPALSRDSRFPSPEPAPRGGRSVPTPVGGDRELAHFQGSDVEVGSDTRIVVGVDSAELTGIAVLRGHDLVKHGTVTIGGWADVERVADRLAAYSPALIAVEDCFVRPNDHTGIVLAKLVGRWEQAFQSRGIATTTVLASTWQPAVLRITHRAKRAERKAAAVAWALQTFGAQLGEDAADAVGIAWWAAHQGLPPVSGVSRQLGQGKIGATSAVRNCPETGGCL